MSAAATGRRRAPGCESRRSPGGGPARARAARALAGALGLAALGCGRAAPPARAPAAAAAAALFIGRTPARAYREVGLVQALGTGIRTSQDDVLRSLRWEGRRLGCDAIVNVSVQAAGTKAHAVGVCVHWVEGPGGAPVEPGGAGGG